jgi:hypothetical protein
MTFFDAPEVFQQAYETATQPRDRFSFTPNIGLSLDISHSGYASRPSNSQACTYTHKYVVIAIMIYNLKRY